MSERPEIATELSCAAGEFTLRRLPAEHHPSLRAWDAADEYLITTLAEAPTASETLLVNDAFGALSVALHAANPTLWFDNRVEARAQQNNLALNNLPPLPQLAQTQPPPASASQVVMKLPRSSALLDWQLAQLNLHLPVGTPVMLAGMLKHVTPADQKVMQARLGDVTASRIVRKARYWRAVTTAANTVPAFRTVEVPECELSLQNHPGVYSPKRLDPGAACLLQYLPKLDVSALPAKHHVIDLCCGNGVLGLAWLQLYPQAEMLFTDASAAAVISATASAQHNLPATAHWSVTHRDGLADAPARSADLILCNPPFHQADTITTDVARQLFHEARTVLKADGQLIAVANRHLGYHQLLKSYFADVTTLSSDSRFVVFAAKQPRQKALTV